MKLRWLRSGRDTLRQHVDFISIENPAAAVRVRRQIRAAILRLIEFPQSGRKGHVTGTRELVVPKLPYVVVYRVSHDAVEIIRVLHTSMDWSADTVQ